jgi:hypothetical protein
MKVTDEKLDGRVRKMLMVAGKEDWLQLYSLLSASTTSTASITESPFQLMIQIHLDVHGYLATSSGNTPREGEESVGERPSSDPLGDALCVLCGLPKIRPVRTINPAVRWRVSRLGG